MEKYFMDNRTYLGAGRRLRTSSIGPRARTTISGSPASASPGRPKRTWSRRPGPAAASTGFVYTVNQANAKTSAGTGGKYTNGACWALRKDGSC